jgi:hypothetical protein
MSDRSLHECPFRRFPLDTEPIIYVGDSSSCIDGSTIILCFSFEKKVLASIAMSVEAADVMVNGVRKNIEDWKIDVAKRYESNKQKVDEAMSKVQLKPKEEHKEEKQDE